MGPKSVAEPELNPEYLKVVRYVSCLWVRSVNNICPDLCREVKLYGMSYMVEGIPTASHESLRYTHLARSLRKIS